MKIKSFLEFLNEVGDQPYDIIWDRNNINLNGKFYIDNIEFNIAMTPLHDDTGNDIKIYQFKFYRGKEIKMFCDVKYNFKVFSTIKRGLYYAMKEIMPDILVFAASDENKARKALYKTAAGGLAGYFNYHDITRDSDLIIMKQVFGDVVFGVYKNKEIMALALQDAGF